MGERKQFQKVRMISLALLAGLLTMLFASQAMADGAYKGVDYAKKVHVSQIGETSYGYWEGAYYMRLPEAYSSSKILSVVSSKPGVVKITDFWPGEFYFETHKTGTATVTIKLELASGKTKTLKSKITVHKLENPVKKLTCAGKKVKVQTSLGKYSFFSNYSTKKSSVKAVLTLKKNWKVVQAYNYNGKVKLSKLKLEQYGGYYTVELYNTSTKVSETLYLNINREG